MSQRSLGQLVLGTVVILAGVVLLLDRMNVVSAGSVNFMQAPGNQGTEVRVHLQYAPPLGRVGSAAATLSGHPPSLLVREALRDIKRYLEIGHSVVLTP